MKSTRKEAERLQSAHPKYKAFQEDLTSALNVFEKATEWPDLIKSLTLVNKVLHKYSHITTIPSLVLLAKRLAQCLNPVLPGGVHLKTLETYSSIFHRIGPNILVQNLSLFSTGLFPLLAYASTRVRPQLIKIYEDFYLPLKQRLIPALPGFILALLPALEDEAAEGYSRVLRLMNNVRRVSSPSVFLVSLWRCMLTCPQCRLSAVNYLRAAIPSNEDLDAFLPTNRSIAIEAIISTLHDSNVLAQRGMFEILISHFPLHTDVWSPAQTVDILHGALPVLLRRETSVNRRFYSWLLGNSQSGKCDVHTLWMLTRALLRIITELMESDGTTVNEHLYPKNTAENVADGDSRAVDRDGAREEESESAVIRPFELLSLLLERTELRTSRLLENVTPLIIAYSYHCYCFDSTMNQTYSTPLIGVPEDSDMNFFRKIGVEVTKLETPRSGSIVAVNSVSQVVLKAAQGFFRNEDIKRVWGCLLTMIDSVFDLNIKSIPTTRSTKWIEQVSKSTASLARMEDPFVRTLVLVDFALDFLPMNISGDIADSMDYEVLIIAVLNGLENLSWSKGAKALGYGIQFVLKMTNRLAKGASSLPVADVVEFLGKFPLPVGYCESVHYLGSSEVVQVANESEECGVLDGFLDTLNIAFRLFTVLLCRVQTDAQSLVRGFYDYIVEMSLCDNADITCIAVQAWLRLLHRFPELPRDDSQVTRICEKLWSLLGTQYAQCHYQVCQLLLAMDLCNSTVRYRSERSKTNSDHLDFLSGEQNQILAEIAETTIADKLLHPQPNSVVEGYRKFSVLWKLMEELSYSPAHRWYYPVFPNALMLMLDALDDRRPPVRLIARTWFQDAIKCIRRVLDPLCETLLDPSTDRLGVELKYRDYYDARLALYVMSKINSVFITDHALVMENVIGTSLSCDLAEAFQRQQAVLLNKSDPNYDFDARTPEHLLLPDPVDYLDVLVFITVRFIQGVIQVGDAPHFDPVFVEQSESVRSYSVEVLKTIITHIPHKESERARSLSVLLSQHILTALNVATVQKNFMMQVQLLDLLNILLGLAHTEDSENAVMALPLFSSTLLTGIQTAHQDYKNHYRYAPAIAKNNGRSPVSPPPSSETTGVEDESLSPLSRWVWFANQCMPYLKRSLPALAVSCCTVLCQEIQSLDNERNSVVSGIGHPFLLQCLRGILHFCLFPAATPEDTAAAELEEKKTAESTSTMFAPISLISGFVGGIFSSKDRGSNDPVDPIEEARNAMFEMLGVCIEAVVYSWGISVSTRAQTDAKTTSYIHASKWSRVRHRQQVKKDILDLLTPILKLHPQRLMRAFLHAWEKALTQKTRLAADSLLLSVDSAGGAYETGFVGSGSLDTMLEVLNALKGATPVLVIASVGRR